ncbi:uncharacterized protein plekhg6 [Aplochiton taeniatus]
MDPTKPGLPSKQSNANNGTEGIGSPQETAVVEQGDGMERERPRHVDSQEVDAVDGVCLTAETVSQRWTSSDPHKYNTGGFQRRAKQKVVTEFATISKAPSAAVKPRAALRQVLFSQGGSEKSPVSEERVQLDGLKQALEAFHVPTSLRWSWREDSQGTTLENSWTDIVVSHSTMSRTLKNQQEALWEFVHTELTYINKLTVVKDLVIAALTDMHQFGYLLEVTTELLFYNLTSILSAHRLFWQEVVYPMLHEVRRTGRPFDPLRLEAGCLQFHKRFESYLPYCWTEENTLEFTRRQMENNPQFLTYLTWVETHPQCHRMRLGDMQAKPHQRITKYPLLLMAVLKTTQDPHTQNKVRGMLASVNGFLYSINDYLRLKDEEMALSISAQRVAGYEVMPRTNEEIYKYVQNCIFDLTCPVKGVGPRDVRKLLLEETLKIRGRKDNKLEVVALLFSDVLLITKVQKKTDRLKVVRPPVVLDRTFCAVLKDGCSFVLVEMSDLGCAANVYTLCTSTSERPSAWVSAIHQAQNTLHIMREAEAQRRLLVHQRRQETPPEDTVSDDDAAEQPPDRSEINAPFVALVEEPVSMASVKGVLTAGASATDHQTEGTATNTCSGLTCRQHSTSDGHSRSARGSFAGQLPENRQGTSGESEDWTELGEIKERRVTWNHHRKTARDRECFLPNQGGADILTNRPNKLHLLSVGEYPEIDYPHPEPSPVLPPSREDHPSQSISQSELRTGLAPGERSLQRGSGFQTEDQEFQRDSLPSQSGDEDALTESWRFIRKLRSPRLQRRKPVNSNQNSPPQMSHKELGAPRKAATALHTNSSSNSDSDSNQKLKGNLSSPGSDSHRVLKLGSLNPRVFWNMPVERVSPEPQALSESELPMEMPQQKSQKRPKYKTQRSASIPDTTNQRSQRARLPSTTSRPIIVEVAPSPPPGPDPLVHPSPLEELLVRANERVRDREGVKRMVKANTLGFKTGNPPSSPSFSTTPLQFPSDGDRETEWEEVHLMRCRAPTVSQGWREALVDGDEEGKKSSPVSTEGVNVDWPVWCFSEEEVVAPLSPQDVSMGNEGLLEGIERALTLGDFQYKPEHKDIQCSQV